MYKKSYTSNETNIIETCLGDIDREGVDNVGWVNVHEGKCWDTVIHKASDLLYCLKMSF